jgi:hypothetical protein
MNTHAARWRSRQGYPPVYPRILAHLRWLFAVGKARA